MTFSIRTGNLNRLINYFTFFLNKINYKQYDDNFLARNFWWT